MIFLKLLVDCRKRNFSKYNCLRCWEEIQVCLAVTGKNYSKNSSIFSRNFIEPIVLYNCNTLLKSSAFCTHSFKTLLFHQLNVLLKWRYCRPANLVSSFCQCEYNQGNVLRENLKNCSWTTALFNCSRTLFQNLDGKHL